MKARIDALNTLETLPERHLHAHVGDEARGYVVSFFFIGWEEYCLYVYFVWCMDGGHLNGLKNYKKEYISICMINFRNG